ncbi:MAG TPA: hypothetical protein VNJ01_04875 [Bacteriovoracaceae bacterium]|nr:hypothetical protein [Bacteriovoracaceae bacterium]
MEATLAPVLELHGSKKLSDSEFTAIYILTYLSLRYPKLWLGSRKKIPAKTQELSISWKPFLRNLEPNIQRRLMGIETVGEIFENFALKSTPESVQRSVLMWDSGQYGLELMFRVPAPTEVLDQQIRGRRCVSVILEKERASRYVLGERDALSFTMHDLIHADHFYHNQDSFKGQIGFYGLLHHCLSRQYFDDLLGNKRFMEELEYLISDMNAYCVHLLKCLKSALTFYHPLKNEFFIRWVRSMTSLEEEREALLALNSPEYDPHTQDAVLINWVRNWTSVSNV